MKSDKPLPFIGNNFKALIFESSITQVADALYCRYPDKRVVGFAEKGAGGGRAVV